MNYWVIKDQYGEYLGQANEEDGYAYTVCFEEAERFESRFTAELSLQFYLITEKCAYGNKNSYTFEEHEAEVENTLETHVAALEALVSRGVTPTVPPPQSDLEDATEAFTLSELKNSVSWYCGEDSAEFPAHERNGDLWALWEKVYWQGVKYAKECMTQAIEDIASESTEV